MFCKQCGNEVSDNAVFCKKCGCKVEEFVKPQQIKKKKNLLPLIITLLIIVLILAGILVAILIVPSASADAKYKKQLELAKQYYKEMEYEKAIAEYEEAIKIDPNNADAYIGLADVYVAMGDEDMAIEVLESIPDDMSNAAKKKIEKKIEAIENGDDSDDKKNDKKSGKDSDDSIDEDADSEDSDRDDETSDADEEPVDEDADIDRRIEEAYAAYDGFLAGNLRDSEWYCFPNMDDPNTNNPDYRHYLGSNYAWGYYYITSESNPIPALVLIESYMTDGESIEYSDDKNVYPVIYEIYYYENGKIVPKLNRDRFSPVSMYSMRYGLVSFSGYGFPIPEEYYYGGHCSELYSIDPLTYDVIPIRLEYYIEDEEDVYDEIYELIGKEYVIYEGNTIEYSGIGDIYSDEQWQNAMKKYSISEGKFTYSKVVTDFPSYYYEY